MELDFAAMAALIAAATGLALGILKVVTEQAALARFERLINLREKLPSDSLARANVEESLDWLAQKVLLRERRPISVALRGLGFLVYFAGIMLAQSAFAQVQEGRLSEDPVDVIGWLVSSLLLIVFGLHLFMGFVFRSRLRKLRSLSRLEQDEIIQRHKRHDLSSRGERVDQVLPLSDD